MGLETPVVMTVFNRPETTANVFGRIAQAKPKTLLVIADGPREGNKTDPEKCRQVREIFDHVNWDCEVIKNYATFNRGPTLRAPRDFKWVFETVEEAIILEDDCVPEPTFFQFCDELLARYRQDERIMMICGNNENPNQPAGRHSYYFSRLCRIWGWATWARAWRLFDVEMRAWPEIRDNGWLEQLFPDPDERYYRQCRYEETFTSSNPSWGYQWSFSIVVNNGLIIRPSHNLVTNIGFGANASHTKAPTRLLLPSRPMLFPLRHPNFVLRDTKADREEMIHTIGLAGFGRLRSKARRLADMFRTGR